jgi:hypothetical protein
LPLAIRHYWHYWWHYFRGFLYSFSLYAADIFDTLRH